MSMVNLGVNQYDRFHGQSVYTLPGAAVIVDSELAQKHIDDVQTYATNIGADLFPHSKSHNTVKYARDQVASGAAGVTVATVQELAIMIQHGIDSVILANEVVDPDDLQLLSDLRRTNDGKTIVTAVDSIEIARLLADTTPSGIESPVLININTGLGRDGVEPHEPALQLAQEIERQFGQRLPILGVMTHEGHAYGAENEQELLGIAIQTANTLRETAELFGAHGINGEVRSMGSTPTILAASRAHLNLPGINNLRPGNYLFQDLVVNGFGLCETDDIALSVLGRVQKVNDQVIVVNKVGSKILSSDTRVHSIKKAGKKPTRYGVVKEDPRLVLNGLSEKHGKIIHPPKDHGLNVGDARRILPVHACQVPYLSPHGVVFEVKGEIVEGVYPVIRW